MGPRPTMRHSPRTLVDRQYTSLVVDLELAQGNYSAQSGTGGRYVLGWYHANAYTGRNGNAYLHSIPVFGVVDHPLHPEYIMGGFKIKLSI